MISVQPKEIMKRTMHLQAYDMYLHDFPIDQIAYEIGKTTTTIRNWEIKFNWRHKKAQDLRDIEQEMIESVRKAREQIINIGTQTLDDIFIRDEKGNITGVSIMVENVRDLKVLSETIMKTAGIPDKIEEKVTKQVTGEVTLKTEKIDPEMAAELGKLIAMKESAEVDE